MVRNAWYAIAESGDVATQPTKYTVHGRDFIVYRTDAGQVYATEAYCPHRGCDLEQATLHEDELVCPFHGWRFNCIGQCTHIPANRKHMPLSLRRILKTYPVVERAGLVWIYTQENGRISNDSTVPEQPFEQPFPELDNAGWQPLHFNVTWNAHISRVVESVLDVSHLPFVHPEQTGRDVSPIVDGPEHIATESGIKIFPKPFSPAHPMAPIPYEPDTTRQTEIELQFPNHWMIRSPIGDISAMCTYLTFTPVDEEHTRIFGIALRNFDFDNEFLNVFHIDHTLYVMGQDQEIIESIRPRRVPFDLRQEQHVPSDMPTIKYRLMLKKAIEAETESL